MSGEDLIVSAMLSFAIYFTFLLFFIDLYPKEAIEMMKKIEKNEIGYTLWYMDKARKERIRRNIKNVFWFLGTSSSVALPFYLPDLLKFFIGVF
jgi:hypothetical protein